MHSALVADGVDLANLLEWVQWDEDPVQLTLCSACGTVGCEVGGYVAPRRLDGKVVLAPSRKGYEATDAPHRDQYAPPAWLRRARRAPLIEIAEWERLRSDGARLPSVESFQPLSWAEAFLLAQLEAQDVFGPPGSARNGPLSAEVAGTDPWIAPEALDDLGRQEFWERRTGTPRLRESGFEPVTLFLETPLRSVVPFAVTPDGVGLHFEPGLVLV